jgi:hypothetical protein
MTPYRGSQFGTGYSAEWLPPNQHTWRILRQAGKVMVFPTQQQAKEAAEVAYWAEPRAKRVAGLPFDEQALADKMAASVEDWLISRRKDRQAQQVLHKPGRRPLVVIPGRARA